MKTQSLDNKNFNFASSGNARSQSNRDKAVKVLKNFKIFAHVGLVEKYQTDENSLNKKIVNDIIYNEKAHVVAQFKDHLIFDDTNEFLRRYYKTVETIKKLPSIFEFYESYSKIFANYIILTESKYMYKNIQRKQKMIDNIQKLQSDRDGNGYDKDNNKIFNTEIYNSIMNQTTQYEDLKPLKNQSIGASSKGKDSVESIEMLIDSIGKAEKVNKNFLDENFNTIASNISEGVTRKTNPSDSRIIRENLTVKIHSPSPSLTVNSNTLINNINNFNKVNNLNSKNETKFQAKIKIEEKSSKNSGTGAKSKSKVTPSPNVAEKFEKIALPERGENTDRGGVSTTTSKLFNINSNNILASSLSGMNTLNMKSTLTGNAKTKTISQNKPISGNTNQNEVANNHTEYYKVSKVGHNHKSTYSMPKLPTKEILSNLIGNYQSTMASSVDKNIISAAAKSQNLIPSRKDNSVGKRPNTNRGSSDIGGLVNSINHMITNINNISSKVSKDSKRNSSGNNKVSTGSNEYIKYISSYTSDISKIKKKVSNLVSDSHNSKLTKKNSLLNVNTSGLGSKYASVINSNGNTISVSNAGTLNANNISNSKIKNLTMKKDQLTNSLTSREIESIREKNSIRALLHRDLFDGDAKGEKIVKKTNVANTKVRG
jgi:hypothetical protein